MTLDVAGVEVLSFDCYGTLVDWEQGILDAALPLLAPGPGTLEPQPLLELYARCESESEAGVFVPYREVLARTMRGMGRALGVSLPDEATQCLADSLPSWRPFPDTVPALRRLASRYRLAVISNVDEDLFAGTSAALDVKFDTVVTAESVRAYKPDVRVFEEAQRRLDVDRTRWLHVGQSLHHDIAPASALGIRTVHVDRRGDRPGGGAVPPSEATATATVASLDALCDLLMEGHTG